jgi:multicomponent Na+:H+ antiporter subunit B
MTNGLNIELTIDIVLLSLLVLTAVAIARSKDLFAAVMFAGIYGLLSASFFVLMDAVDVAFTEAAVGAGIAPVLMFTTLATTGRYQHSNKVFSWLALLMVILVGALLIVATFDMPAFGSLDAPAHQHVAPRYLLQSKDEIGIPNVVTSVLASYRAFDTLGEVVVIFTAGIAVLGILFSSRQVDDRQRLASLHQHKVLRIVGKILIPPILIFALYVQFHGEYGPGGGFQAGVIFAAALILYGMLFGMQTAKQVIHHQVVRALAAVGVLLYGTVGVLGLLTGKNFLDYSGLAGDPITGQHIGIVVIELGVGITVAAVMLLLYFAFAERIQLNGGD